MFVELKLSTLLNVYVRNRKSDGKEIGKTDNYSKYFCIR